MPKLGLGSSLPSRALCAALLATALAAAPASAASARSMTHDEVWDAVREGRLAPLDTILGAVRSKFELQVVDVRALNRGDAYLFEVLILESDGGVLQLYYDGRSATLIAWTGVGAEDVMSSEAFIDRVFARLPVAGGGGAAPQ